MIPARAREDFTLVSLAAPHGGGGLLAARIGEQLGLALPPPGRWSAAGGFTALCTTPGQWLVMRDGDDGALYDRLRAVVQEAGTLIDLSASRVAVRVSGERARAALATLLPLDLHPRAMQAGCAAATLAAHLPVLVRQIDDTPAYELMCARSFAGSFHRALHLAGMRIAPA